MLFSESMLNKFVRILVINWYALSGNILILNHIVITNDDLWYIFSSFVNVKLPSLGNAYILLGWTIKMRLWSNFITGNFLRITRQNISPFYELILMWFVWMMWSSLTRKGMVSECEFIIIQNIFGNARNSLKAIPMCQDSAFIAYICFYWWK